MAESTWTTKISYVKPDEIRLRGYRIEDLMGRISFGEGVYLVLKGELPRPEISALLEAILVSCIDHGVTPPSVLTTRTIASTGSPLNAAVAGGILAISKWHGGAIEDCMNQLRATRQIMIENKLNAEQAAEKMVAYYRETKQRLSGFGHLIHTSDPRTDKLFAMAEQAGLTSDFLVIIKALSTVIDRSLGKKMAINVDGAIAAILCELDFPPEIANSFFMISRLPGMVAHFHEESTTQKPLRAIKPDECGYNGPADRDPDQ